MRNNEFRGTVTKGLFKPYASDAWEKTMKYWEGKKVEVVIRKPKTVRTTQQNRYYWWILNFIKEEYGQTKDDLHQHFGYMFLRKGGKLMASRSTTKLSTKEFKDYIDKIVLFMGEFGFVIPSADEVGFYEY